MEPSALPWLCAFGVAMAALLLAPRSEPPRISPAPPPVQVAPPPDDGPRVVFRTLDTSPKHPIFAVFEDGTALHKWPAGPVVAGPLAPELDDALAALRAATAPFAHPAERTGCLQHGGLELQGEGSDDIDDRIEATRKLSWDIMNDLLRKEALMSAPVIVAATVLRVSSPESITLRVDQVLHTTGGQPSPAAGVVVTLPSHLLDLSWGTDQERAGVWIVESSPSTRWSPRPQLDVEQTRRDLEWLEEMPPEAEREALARRARQGIPEAPTASR